MKVVINAAFGGFGLSPKALLRAYELGAQVGTPVEQIWPPDASIVYEDEFGFDTALKLWREYLAAPDGNKPRSLLLVPFSPDERFALFDRDLKRNDPILVRVVEELGQEADGEFATLKVVDVPDGVEWHVSDYDGWEHVAENHRTWR